MLTYTYHCEANGQSVEVQHSMSETLHTWGEVCEKANMAIGNTPTSSPVAPVISGGFLALSSRDKNSPPDGCCNRPDSCLPMASGHCCGSACGCKG